LKFGHGGILRNAPSHQQADGDITSQIGLSGIACLFNIAHSEKLNQ
jgi:hypothetical protein